MDQALLVDEQIEDARAFLAELHKDHLVDLNVAFWVEPRDETYRQLYIGSAFLSSMAVGEAFRRIYSALSRTLPSSISLSDIKLVPPTNPAAMRAIEIRDRHSANVPTRVSARHLGDLPIEYAYIYPKNMGKLSRDEVVRTVAYAMSGSDDLVPYSIELQDGTSFQAVPMRIERVASGGLRIVFHDIDKNRDLTVSADEVVSIR